MVNKSIQYQYQNNRKNTNNVDELSTVLVGMRKVRGGGVKKYFRVIHISSTNSSINVYYL